MKTVIIKSIMLIVVVIGLVHYALYLKTGRLPWGSSGGPNLSLPASLSKASLPTMDKVMPASTTKIYKWVDENGVLNYSQEPPPASANGELVEVNANVNIIQSTPVPTAEPTAAGRPKSALIGNSSLGDSEKTPVEKAQEAKDLLEAREREMKKILDNL